MFEHYELSRVFFMTGGTVFALLCGLHALGALADSVAPRWFTPVDDGLREAMKGTGVAFHPGRAMWDAWLGFNVSHGLGGFFFGLLCVLVAADDLAVAHTFAPLFPLTIFMSTAYLLLSIRFWFYGPAIGSALGLGFFVSSYVLV